MFIAVTRQKCLHTRIYTYIHTYIHTHIYTYINTYIYTYTYIHVYTHTYIHKYIYTYTHTHIHIYIYIYIYTHILHFSKRVIMIYKKCVLWETGQYMMYIYIYIYVCVCVYIYISSNRWDRLWGPRSLLRTGTRVFLRKLRGCSVNLIILYHLAYSLRMSKANFHSPYTLSWRGQEQLYLMYRV